MVRYLAGRVLQAFLGLIFITTLVFFLVRLTGDPARILMSDFAPLELREQLAERLGLDRPLYEQYFSYMSGLVRLDLGDSFNGQPVLDILLARLPATASLALAALVVAIILGLPLGILSAVYRGSAIDMFSRSVALFGQSVPAFWLAIMLVLIFAVILRWFPVAYGTGPESYVLPAIAVGWAAVAGIARLVRSSMLDVLSEDYVRTARAKGLSEWVVVNVHALKNASIPLVTMAGIELGLLLGGTVVTETVFAWPGIGLLTIQALQSDDFPVIQAAVFLLAFIFVFVNLVVDVMYAWLDPRIRYA